MQQSGFVNAILRTYTREKDQTRALLLHLKKNQPYLGYSHPEWIYRRWCSQFGQDATCRLMDWNNQAAPSYARLNTLKMESRQLQDLWTAEKVEASAHTWDWSEKDTVFRLDSAPNLHELPSFQNGGYYIQDPSTLLSLFALCPQPGETILDFCAAPGGKTTFIAQKMNNTGTLIACDLAQRLPLLKENCQRLGVTCATFEAVGPQVQRSADIQFDRILVDAPCSNTGVFRRRLDARWRLQEPEIPRLSDLQQSLLATVVPWLKPEGTLVYSTCSLEPEENTGTVGHFLEKHPEFHLDYDRSITPINDGVDGAYVARLKRKKR
jgi:16S rRNA (cytosine967-C5)-methyltransferase